MRAPGRKRKAPARAAPPIVSARLSGHIALEAGTDGNISASFEGQSVDLGKFSASAVRRSQELRTGLPLRSFAQQRSNVDKEIELLVRRLARRGLLEYRLGRAGEDDIVVIEPQVSGYWPRMAELGNANTIVLSRFAYLRRRGNEMVLESPRAGALFRICDPKVASTLASLSTPQKLGRLRRQDGFPGLDLLALLMDCHFLFKVDADAGDSLRSAEGDDNLVLWDFHDLLFHTHTTEGRHANPLGGVYPYAGMIAPPPAVRPPWPGKTIDLRKLSAASTEPASPFVTLLRERHSMREFDDRNPITLDELSRFLEATSRVHAKWESPIDLGDTSPVVDYAIRPYPAGGSAYELELYLAVANCDGLPRGFYHYDADRHALAPIALRGQELEALWAGAEFAMDAPAPPQILITIAARFDRVAWKYSSIAYALILKDAGVLIQTLYLMATEMGLGGCAIGSTNIDLFSKMTGIEFHVEGPVVQFALGRGKKPDGSD